MLDEPTRGVDVGAKAEICGLIRQLASEGLSVLFSSSDTTEIRELADRVLVLSRGILAAELDVTAADDERVLVAASASTLEKVGVHA
jgi:ABC-type sugar transport system ATPase subunit